MAVHRVDAVEQRDTEPGLERGLLIAVDHVRPGLRSVARGDRAPAGKDAAETVGRDERWVGGDVGPFGLGHLADLLRRRHPRRAGRRPAAGWAGAGSCTPAAPRRAAGPCVGAASPGACSIPTARAAMTAVPRTAPRGVRNMACFSLPDQEAGRPPWPTGRGITRALHRRKAIDPGQCRILPSAARVPPLSALIVLAVRDMAGSGALERLRAANQRAVIGLLAGEGPMSRADLVRASGLSRTTVSSLVARADPAPVRSPRPTTGPGRTRAAADAHRCR